MKGVIFMLKKLLYLYIMSYYANKWNYDYAIRRRKVYEYLLREGAARLSYKRVKSMIWDIIYNEPKLAALCFDIPSGRVGPKDLLFEFTDYTSAYFDQIHNLNPKVAAVEVVGPVSHSDFTAETKPKKETIRVIFAPEERPVINDDPSKHLMGYGVKFTVMDELGRTGTSYSARK